MNHFLSLVFFLLGLVSISMFYYDVFFSVGFSVVVYVSGTFGILYYFLKRRIGFTVVFLWIAFLLPFIHMIPYVGFDFINEEVGLIWALAVNPYMQDERIIMLAAMLGAVGGLGILFGQSLSKGKIPYGRIYKLPMKFGHTRTLSMPIWLVWVVAGVGLSWLTAPSDTLIFSTYLSSPSFMQGFNFGSAWLVSYVVIIYALADTFFEKDIIKRNIKNIIIIFSIAFIVIYLQLMRGDRESIPLVVAVFLVYFYWGNRIDMTRIDFVKQSSLVGLIFLTLLFVSWFLGIVRSSLVGMSFDQIYSHIREIILYNDMDMSRLFYGTWTGVMMTPLSVAGDYVNGSLPLKYGSDYVDYILSLPPGFVADAIGYVRPISAYTGPAHEMTYGIGGNHAVTVPFMNFRMVGVFLIPAFWTYLISWYEKKSMNNMTVVHLSFLCVFVTIAPHWLWYGEKYGMNALIIWAVLGFLYRVSLSIRWRSS